MSKNGEKGDKLKEEEIKVLDELIKKLGNENLRILDAATGSGMTTLEIAKRVRGKVISVDINPLKTAEKRIRDANLTSKVEFLKGNLAKMDFLDENSMDAIVSHATLSSIPTETPFMLVNVFKEFFRVLKPNGILLVIDYYPLNKVMVKSKADEIAQEAWRVYKAVCELLGDYHHVELPPEWVCETMTDVGFKDVYFRKVSERNLSESFGEYVENMLQYVKEIKDNGLRKAFKNKILQLEKDAKIYGKSDYSDRYCVWGRK